MKSKFEIVENWLPRYTKRPIEDFTEYILLTNFNNYVELFAEWYGVPVLGKDGAMPTQATEGITIINFGMGSPEMQPLSWMCLQPFNLKPVLPGEMRWFAR